uniref:F-box domain-containing protein n=1 Tax=Bursaphelenchus xylophilus TaxID=6326 RepID=A0A1I7RIF7_BURXY
MATVLRRTPALHVFRFLCVNGFEREIVSNNFLHHFLSIHRLENILVVARAYYINVKFYDPKLKPNFQRLSYTFPSVQVFHAFLRLVFLPVAKQVELWGVERVDKRFVEVCKDTVAKYPHIRFHVVLNEDADECRTVLDVLKSQVVSMFSRRPSFLFQMHGAPLRRLDLSGMKYVYPFFAMNVKHVKMGLATFLHTRWPQNPSVERLIFKPSPIQRHRQPGEAFSEIKRCFPNLKLIVIKQLTYLPAEEQTVDVSGQAG